MGISCRVKFRAKLKEMQKYIQEHLIRELVFYFALKNIYVFKALIIDYIQKLGDSIICPIH